MSRLSLPNRKSFLVSVFLASLPALAWSAVTGVVVAVPEGDVVTIEVEHRRLKMRLGEIDAPQPGQPYSRRATASLTEVCLDKPVVVDDIGFDRARGVFGSVECDGVDAGEEQLRRGMAWVPVHLVGNDSPLRVLQIEAQNARRGLWSDAAPVPPWTWKGSTAQ